MNRSQTTSWLKFLFGPWIWLIGFFYRSYTTNRDRLAGLMARPWAAALIKTAVVVTFLAWIVIWLFASDESRTRLTDEVKEQLRGLDLMSEQE